MMFFPDECIRIGRENSLTHRISLLLHLGLGFALASGNKDILLVVGFNYNIYINTVH